LQRFDVFFKEVFTDYPNGVLALLNYLLPEKSGTRIVQDMPTEVIKGALRIDKVFKTDTNMILIIDFEEPFTIDSYFEVLTHTATHIHSKKPYSVIVKTANINMKYVPIIFSISSTKSHLEIFKKNKIMRTIASGVYLLQATPFFPIYLVLIAKLNLARVMLRALELCKDENDCNALEKVIKNPETWEQAISERNINTRQLLARIISEYGRLVILINDDTEFLTNVWRFSRSIEPKQSKDILTAMMLISFEAIREMSVSQILTKEEKKELIEAMGVEDAIAAIGINKVIDVIGIEKVIDAVGVEKVIDAVGIDKVIDAVGIKKIIDELAKKSNLSAKEKEKLYDILLRRKKKE